MFVKVTKSPSDKYWYSKHVGEIIEVEDTDDGDVNVIDWQRYDNGKGNDICGKYIERGDYEVIDDTMKDGANNE